MLRPGDAARYSALLLLLTGCAGSQDPATVGQAAGLPAGEQEVRLAIGETRTLPGGARLSLTAVPGDSRCPRDVACVWAGSVAATLHLTAGYADTTATINSMMEPRAFAFRGWRVALLGASPDPEAGTPIPPESYRVSLTVSRAP